MSVLLHICCGPCSIMPIRQLLAQGHKLHGYFYNPNIHPLAEYLQRRAGAQTCAERSQIEILFEDDWDLRKWLQKRLPMGEERCQSCIGERMQKTASKAKELGYEAFSTTLLYSRYQPHDFIRATGEKLAQSAGLRFVYEDFRKFWQDGIDASLAWGIYRQKYCGCVFSETERYAKKLRALRNKNS